MVTSWQMGILGTNNNMVTSWQMGILGTNNNMVTSWQMGILGTNNLVVLPTRKTSWLLENMLHANQNIFSSSQKCCWRRK